MKKLLLILAVAFIGTQAKGQVKGWYISPGVSYSNHTVSYGNEVGIYTDHVWLSALVSTSKDADSKHWSTFVGLKPYLKIARIKDAVDLYGFYGLYVGTFAPSPLELEPGVAAVYSLTDTFALQLSGSVPLYTIYAFPSGKPSVSLGVNFYFQ